MARPPERLLIDQVAISYLQLTTVQQEYAHQTTKGASIAALKYWEQCLSATQRRHLRAVETLAKVRKLMGINIQVNIAAEGGQQVVANR